MSKQLLRLLDGDVKARMALADLQKMTRDDSDVRLTAELLARANTVVRVLGLDPRDTSAEEIYRALTNVAPKLSDMAVFKDTEWLLAEFDGQILSFHPVDIINNYHHQLPLGKQQVTQGRAGLGREIARRYRENPVTFDRTVDRIVCRGGICWIEGALDD